MQGGSDIRTEASVEEVVDVWMGQVVRSWLRRDWAQVRATECDGVGRVGREGKGVRVVD